MNKLKHCPFCGRKGRIWRTVIKGTRFVVYYVGCNFKNCQVNPCVNIQNSELPIFKDKGLVLNNAVCKTLKQLGIKAWDRRTK